MIRAGRASLVVSSVETDLDLVTQHLGLSPTTVTRKGEVSRSGRVREHHTWAVDAGPLSNDEEDQTGTAALTALLEQCRAAFGRGGLCRRTVAPGSCGPQTRTRHRVGSS